MTPAERRRLAADLRMTCMRVSRRARFETVDVVAPHQISVLAKLEREPMSPRQLADMECVSAPSMSRTLNWLQKRGLVTREADATDGRRSWMHLTDEGRQLLRTTRRSRDEWMQQRIDALSEQDCRTLAAAQEILARVVAR